MRTMRYIRRLSWMISVAPYRNPKELPTTETVFWPLADDPIIKPKSKKLLAKLVHQFETAKWVCKN